MANRPPLKELASKIFVWQRANQFIFLCRNIVLARFIFPSDQGVFATALNLTIYFSLFTTFEFRSAIITTKDPSQKLKNTQWSSELLLTCFTFLIGIIAVPFLIASRGLPIVVCLIGLLIANLLDALTSSHLYLSEKKLEFPFLTAMRTIVNGVSFAVAIGFAVFGFGWKAMLIDRLFSSSVISFILWRRSKLSLRFELDRESLVYLWNFTKTLFVIGAFVKIGTGMDMYVTGKYLGPDDAGLYQMALKWAAIPMDLGGGFLSLMALSWYSSHALESPDALKKAYRQMTFHQIRFCSWVAVGLAMFLGDLFQFVYKAEWQSVPSLYLMLFCFALIRPMYQNCFQAMIASKQTSFLLKASLVHALLAVLLSFALVKWNLSGVIVAATISLGVTYLLIEWNFWRTWKFGIFSTLLQPVLLAVSFLLLSELIQKTLPQTSGFVLRIGLMTVYTAIAYGEWSRGRKAL
jgi:O-antigen/teichoic acid export membrane protein